MAKASEAPDLLRAVREEFVPTLEECVDATQLRGLLDRLAKCLGADGGILWRVEERQVAVQSAVGCVDPTWAAAHSADSAGAAACQGGTSLVFQVDHGPYRLLPSGQDLAQVAAILIRGTRGVAGCVELWWKASDAAPPLLASHLPGLEEIFKKRLPTLLSQEAERRKYLQAISRLMMLYDVGKVFHSTLELSELAPLILARVQNLLEAESAAVWLLDPVRKNLYCAAAGGPQSARIASARVWASDPGLGTAVCNGETLLLHDVEDVAWMERWGAPIHSLLAIPLTHDRRFLGAIEAVRGPASPRFSQEQLHLLIDIGKQAAVALRNAQRLQAERRVKELHALMEISKEITATLDLDRVLATTVNRITTVIPLDRCSISILRKGRWEVSAVSGQMKVDRSDPAVQQLEALHIWQAGFGGDLSVVQTEEGVAAEREDIREKFTAYFQTSGVRALTGLFLQDEEGPVGVLILESKDPQALSSDHNDLARIFANQVTSAVRNALLYQQVPLIGVLHPLIEKRARFSALPAARRKAIIAAGVAAVLFLAFFPWWSKPSGDVRVLPSRIEPISTEVEGVVQRVLVHEGDRMEAGQLLAEMDPRPQRVALEQAQSQRDILARRVLQLEAQGNLGAARIERAQLDQANAELDLQREHLADTQIRSPISGVVITPRLEERVGQYLRRGDVFCQVVDLERAWIEVVIPETDIGEVRSGEDAWVKLNAFPARRFDGRVIRVSPQGREQSDERVFDTIIEVPNPHGLLRAGMMGRGKVLARRSSIGYLMLRAPARWIWLKIWKWLP